jgi:hypothetical protein
MTVAALSLAAVVVLSVLLAKKHSNSTFQANFNPTQIALNSALQAADQVYGLNEHSYPRGNALITQLQTTDPSLAFGFGPQSVASSNDASGPYTPTRISLAVSEDGQLVMFATQDSSGTCWYTTDNHEQSATTDNVDGASPTRGASYASANNQQSCTAGDGLPAKATSWETSWPTS